MRVPAFGFLLHDPLLGRRAGTVFGLRRRCWLMAGSNIARLVVSSGVSVGETLTIYKLYNFLDNFNAHGAGNPDFGIPCVRCELRVVAVWSLEPLSMIGCKTSAFSVPSMLTAAPAVQAQMWSNLLDSDHLGVKLGHCYAECVGNGLVILFAFASDDGGRGVQADIYGSAKAYSLLDQLMIDSLGWNVRHDSALRLNPSS
ncbi:hypothetical protein LX32DRAFT_452396 [Colletotrichum zoysiae]|uniref:Uncharacterized protein n=1 Tax=Colletotrichum zoysiae TaxID=1216348 RepID=A0AAD9HE36_9PEZI|nr:hypothetical protein LX32DRAFT_452396 [Colletotrichum zoysiae]